MSLGRYKEVEDLVNQSLPLMYFFEIFFLRAKITPKVVVFGALSLWSVLLFLTLFAYVSYGKIGY